MSTLVLKEMVGEISILQEFLQLQEDLHPCFMRRSQRAAAVGINYKEPGDYPDLSDSSSESSQESVLDSSVLADFSGSEESVLLDSTVVVSQEAQIRFAGVEGSVSVVGAPLCASSPKSASHRLLCVG